MRGSTTLDATKLKNQILNILNGAKFDKFKSLIKTRRSSFLKIDTDSLNAAIDTITGDGRCFMKIVAQTINSDASLTFQYFDGATTLGANSRTWKAFKNNIDRALLEVAQNSPNGISSSIITSRYGGGVTTRYDGGTHSAVDEQHPNSDFATMLHEIFGHGAAIISQNIGDHDLFSVRFENMVRRLAGQSDTQRDGSNHDDQNGTPMINPEQRPNCDL